MLKIDPNVFTDDAISEETRRFNAELSEKLAAGADPWSMDVKEVRAARKAGKGAFPLESLLEDTETFEIEGSHGPIGMRVISPDSGNENARGVFFHIHGGGWRLGGADMQDQRLKRLANVCNLTCISVEYGLSPENPYPCGPDDCETAALWLVNKGAEHFNTSWMSIGGESAGAHLSVVTLLRLRDKHGLSPFKAAVLIAGAYDFTMTPSTANYNAETSGYGAPVLTTRDIANFADSFLPEDANRRNPDISPMFADLNGMPAAHFCVGTRDALLDDSLFMAQRWAQVQADTELELFAGGCHVFQYFETLTLAKESLASLKAFLNRLAPKT